jgi:hypothetical protein
LTAPIFERGIQAEIIVHNDSGNSDDTTYSIVIAGCIEIDLEPNEVMDINGYDTDLSYVDPFVVLAADWPRSTLFHLLNQWLEGQTGNTLRLSYSLGKTYVEGRYESSSEENAEDFIDISSSLDEKFNCSTITSDSYYGW